MDTEERRRRRDEQVQNEVLGALQRILDVLHDVSDGIRELRESVEAQRRGREISASSDSAEPLLLSIDEAAELIGIGSASMRRLCDASYGPPTVRIGRRIFLQRRDLEHWLERARHESGVASFAGVTA